MEPVYHIEYSTKICSKTQLSGWNNCFRVTELSLPTRSFRDKTTKKRSKAEKAVPLGMLVTDVSGSENDEEGQRLANA